MNLQEANFQDLLSSYFINTGACKASDKLMYAIINHDKKWLTRLLRYHGDIPVSDIDEIEFRDNVDDLIVCFSVLEISITSGLIQPQINDTFWCNSRFILEDEFVQKYYVNYYPDRLPQFLLYRLRGKFEYVEQGLVLPIVMSFLDLDRQFIQNHRNRYLLKMLDDFTISGYRFDDVSSLLEKPAKFINSLLKDPEDKNVLDEAVSEVSLLLEFCFKLTSILKSAQEWPFLQSEIWLRYSYWFDILGDQLHHQLGEAINKFLSWKPLSVTDNILEIRDYVDSAHAVLEQLISAKYAHFADKILTTVKTDNS